MAEAVAIGLLSGVLRAFALAYVGLNRGRRKPSTGDSRFID